MMQFLRQHKKMFCFLFPTIAGIVLIFLAFPYITAGITPEIGKLAKDTGLSVYAIRMIFAVVAAILLVVIFHVLKRVGLKIATIVIIILMLSPMGLYSIDLRDPESLVAYANKVADNVPIFVENARLFYQTYVYSSAKQPIEEIKEKLPDEFWYITSNINEKVDELFDGFSAADQVSADGFYLFKLEKNK